MTCRDIERLILENEEGWAATPEHEAVEAHLRECPDCRRFESALLGIRDGLESLDWEPLPGALDRRTRRLALDALQGESREEWKSLPGRIVAALAALTALTIVWVTVSLAGLEPEQTLRDLPLAAKVGILFIVQNAFVLFFAPIIFRIKRVGSNGHHGIPS